MSPLRRFQDAIPPTFTSDYWDGFNLYLKTDLGMVDCLCEVLGVGDFESVLKQSGELELPFGICRILGLEALVRAKEAMNRDHDRIAVRQLKEIQRRRQQG